MGIQNGQTFLRMSTFNVRVQGVLADLELRIIEFFAEWLVALPMPASFFSPLVWPITL